LPALPCFAKMTLAKSTSVLPPASGAPVPEAIDNTELTAVFTLFDSMLASIAISQKN
jgi:hypothetical protein